MAKVKTVEGESSYSYFQRLFRKNRKLLRAKKNEIILAHYRADHGLAPDAPLEKKIVNNMTNLKSTMRSKRSKKKAAQALATGVPVAKAASKLERLEEMIDDCLTFARNLDREGLQEIIHSLHRARNQVVWKLG